MTNADTPKLIGKHITKCTISAMAWFVVPNCPTLSPWGRKQIQFTKRLFFSIRNAVRFRNSV